MYGGLTNATAPMVAEGPGYESAKLLAQLHDQIGMLEARLSPVLRMGVKMDQSASPMPDMSPVTIGIRNASERLTEILARIDV